MSMNKNSNYSVDESLTIHYRYQTVETERSVYADLTIFLPLQETSCGFWVMPKFMTYPGMEKHPAFVKKFRRWVSKTGLRRYCYPDKAQAFESYKIRVSHYIGHLENNLKKANYAKQLTLENPKVEKSNVDCFALI